MAVSRGDAFKRRRSWEPTGHVWVVASDRDAHDRVVCVAFTTRKYRPLEDVTCVLQKGDHPFVRHPTLIAYWDAELLPVDDIEQNLKIKNWTAEERCKTDLLARICAGFTSDSAPPEAQEIMRAQGHIAPGE